MTRVSTSKRRVAKESPLPLPSLREILECYVRFLEPLGNVENKEESLSFIRGVLLSLQASKGCAPDQLRDAVAYFRLLESIAKAYKQFCNESLHTSHMTPLWNAMYLSTRDPLPFGWNYTLQLDSPPLDNLAKGVGVSMQALRASIIGTASLHFRSLLGNPKFFTPEFQGRVPKMCRLDLSLCGDQFTRLFRTVRIPHEGVDGLRWSLTNKVLVLHRGNAFVVDWIRFGGINGNGSLERICVEEIIANAHLIEALKSKALSLPRNRSTPLVLANGCRKKWARAFGKLWLEQSSREALDEITSCSFGIALDENTDLSRCLHGGACPENRYPDMNVTYAIGPNGESSCNMEHSWGDGSTLAAVCAFVNYYNVSFSRCFTGAIDPPKTCLTVMEAHMHMVHWGNAICTHVLQDIQKFHRDHNLRVKQMTLALRRVNDFGTNEIKQRCGSSPDAFMHAAFHIAQKRLFGDQRSTYCALLMKKYHHGRTETLRTVTHSTQTLAKLVESAKGERSFSPNIRTALHNVSEEHRERIILCRSGKGFHRAVTLLSRFHKEVQERLHHNPSTDVPWDVNKGVTHVEKMFFASQALRELCSDYLSTSNMSAPGILSFSFAATHPDGVGIGYSLSPKQLSFTVSAFTECKRPLAGDQACEETNVAIAFANAIEDAVKDLYDRTALPLQSKL
ncbi:carnitine O-palmitoyltransferase, putative [Trypanosoma brucei brucei TREU927]|uniref:Carnitine O-palmitoyltransferase, putative n=1 Tax=Trypanosoma brucei brucei (strain 927/4 GUTat10.1) TaxID=185431 RepID=Q57YH1_TRYB2|nr:carnitine O-palmitoyltransferase, putative [Trypanosoma brucei brucei TREU927]AAX69347.1 carnitine O-palmitoyltransferase, putative [Trypanosoma brucei]AAZ12830.1 carnitine O-palmitoyltransferase, putative [Trypanosoma brucei brucei TREU927]